MPEKQSGIQIYTLSGRIDATNAHIFEKEMLEHLSNKPQKLLISFKDLEYISSAGLRSFLLIAKTAKNLEQNLFLSEMSENIAEVFKVTGFITLFQICSKREEALAKLV